MFPDGTALEGSADRAREYRNRVLGLITQLDLVYDAGLLDGTIKLAREAVVLSESDADIIEACLLLAYSLVQRYKHRGDDRSLEEAVDLQRVALAFCPNGHPSRAQSCGNLAGSLMTCYERSGNDCILDEAIDLQREALALRPQGHPKRAVSCGNLAIALRTRYDRTSDDALLDEAIDLEREALALCPEGHPSHALCCANLAKSLRKCYSRTGDDALLDESIALQRVALVRCPERHPSYPGFCAILANSLLTCYQRTGDDALLDEVIDLERKALDLVPQGHPGRAASCASLSNSLGTRYQRTGNDALLDEAIDLQREAFALRPEGHPRRAVTCANLASALRPRYERTGDDRLLDEVIDLQREALALYPEENPHRVAPCTNLALSLIKRYYCTGDDTLLDEATELQRQALAFCPKGHPDHAGACGNLAISLRERYERTGDDHLLDEAINLEREALALRPQGHSHRATTCRNLALSLRTHYERTGDERLLDEIWILSREAQTIAPVHTVWSHLCQLSWLHLQRTSSFYDVNSAIQCLSQSLEHEFNDVSQAVSVILSRLDNIWNHEAENKNTQLTNIYHRLVSLLPLLSNSALDVQSRLQALKGCSHIGSDAFVNAALAESSMLGLEFLELAQGVIWSQSLNHRDPQLQDVPDHLAKKLEDHLRVLARRSAFKSYDTAQRSAFAPHDIQHKHSSRAYALIREIRVLPGLDRFMMGETYKTLCTAASNHPVVVLVGSHGHYYALIIAASLVLGYVLLPIQLNVEDVQHLSFEHISPRPQRCGPTPEDKQPEEQRMSFGVSAHRRSGPLDLLLKALWYKVVEPVFDVLELKVGTQSSHRVRPTLTRMVAITRSGSATHTLVSYWHLRRSSTTRCWYLRRTAKSLLCRLCGFVVYPYSHSASTCTKRCCPSEP
jgi:hypothetical protein